MSPKLPLAVTPTLLVHMGDHMVRNKLFTFNKNHQNCKSEYMWWLVFLHQSAKVLNESEIFYLYQKWSKKKKVTFFCQFYC